MVEVEEADGAGPLASRTVNREGHAVGQVLVDSLVASHAQGVDMFELEDDAVGLRPRHPLVEAEKGCLEPASSATPDARCRVLLPEALPRDVGPAETAWRQVEGGPFGVVVFVELGWGGHGSSLPRLSQFVSELKSFVCHKKHFIFSSSVIYQIMFFEVSDRLLPSRL